MATRDDEINEENRIRKVKEDKRIAILFLFAFASKLKMPLKIQKDGA